MTDLISRRLLSRRLLSRRLLSLSALLGVLAPTALALADDYVDYNPAQASPSLSAPLFVIIAYSTIWIAVVGFTLMLWGRQRRINEELDDAQRRLAELEHESAK
ncbi:MAG: CcmD family protein [Deltaproteobacteria bacterium]|nr:CcmD family protein [Deltaproteobacteria bacterium]